MVNCDETDAIIPLGDSLYAVARYGDDFYALCSGVVRVRIPESERSTTPVTAESGGANFYIATAVEALPDTGVTGVDFETDKFVFSVSEAVFQTRLPNHCVKRYRKR